jgi:hypothetical protein
MPDPTRPTLDAINQRWKALVDDGFQIRLKGAQVHDINERFWQPRAAKTLPPTFPDGVMTSLDHELLPRVLQTTVLWKSDDGYYIRQDVLEPVYEIKPEVIR